MLTVLTCGNCGARNRVNQGMAQPRNLRTVCGRCGARLAAGEDAGSGGYTGDAAGAGGVKSQPIKVTDASFARDVLGEGVRPVLLDCWAEWCGPCRMIAPALDELAAEGRGRYVIAKLNVDENPLTSAQFAVRSIPTLLIFKHGQLVERVVGAQPKQAIAARLAAHI